MKKRKPKKKAAERPTDADRLFQAVSKYIEASGGTVVVAGPIQIIRWPFDAEYKFTLGIQITGKAPPRVSP